jgi:hypothetical protein
MFLDRDHHFRRRNRTIAYAAPDARKATRRHAGADRQGNRYLTYIETDDFVYL